MKRAFCTLRVEEQIESSSVIVRWRPTTQEKKIDNMAKTTDNQAAASDSQPSDDATHPRPTTFFIACCGGNNHTGVKTSCSPYHHIDYQKWADRTHLLFK